MSGGAPRPGRRRHPVPNDLTGRQASSDPCAFLAVSSREPCGSPWIVIRVTGTNQEPASQGDDMYTEMALTARRFALTLAVAGLAAMGSVAIAPAASAAQNGSDSVSERSGDNGPDAFLEREHGRQPIFFCDEEKPNKQHNNCIDLTAPTRF
jgi:hypothetical protein